MKGTSATRPALAPRPEAAPGNEFEREARAVYAATGLTWPPRDPSAMAPVIDDTEHAPTDDMAEDGSVILHDGFRFSFKDGMAPETLAQWVDVDLLYTLGNALISTVDVGAQKAKGLVADLRSEVARIELENARLKAAVSELTAKVETLTFISERLRLENKGAAGERGPMGRDGHDGARGQRGERGERGPAGPRITNFEADDEQFSVTLHTSDGRSGPTMRLRSLFERFAEEISDADLAAEHDAIEASRQAVEREAANVRLGLPAR